jgi:hypothetical protein
MGWLLYYLRVKKLAREKHSSLFCVSDAEKKFCFVDTCFAAFKRFCPRSWSWRRSIVFPEPVTPTHKIIFWSNSSVKSFFLRFWRLNCNFESHSPNLYWSNKRKKKGEGKKEEGGFERKNTSERLLERKIDGYLVAGKVLTRTFKVKSCKKKFFFTYFL